MLHAVDRATRSIFMSCLLPVVLQLVINYVCLSKCFNKLPAVKGTKLFNEQLKNFFFIYIYRSFTNVDQVRIFSSFVSRMLFIRETAFWLLNSDQK